MPPLIDLVGQRFGRLTVIKRAENSSSGHPKWECQCECGNIVVALGSNLKKGVTKSCGCLHKEVSTDRILLISENQKGKNHPLYKHGKSKSRIHWVWEQMKQRCHSPRNRNYKYYGGRGITMCPEWKDDFKAFHDWAMANGYLEGLTIDRIDNDRGYSPDNCRWVTQKQQIKNRRNFGGKNNG